MCPVWFCLFASWKGGSLIFQFKETGLLPVLPYFKKYLHLVSYIDSFSHWPWTSMQIRILIFKLPGDWFWLFRLLDDNGSQANSILRGSAQRWHITYLLILLTCSPHVLHICDILLKPFGVVAGFSTRSHWHICKTTARRQKGTW